MKKLILILVCSVFAICSQGAAAQSGAGAGAGSGGTTERPLPNMTARDHAGASVNTESLLLEQNWVLIVLDASLSSTQRFLAALASKPETFDQRTTVLLIGSDATLEGLRKEQEGLSGIRWIYASESSVIKQLELPGVPSMLGIRPNRRIDWKFSGIPNPPERALSMIQGWLRMQSDSSHLAK